MSEKIFNIANALHSLVPGANWKYNDEDFSTLEWLSDDVIPPTKAEVEQELQRLQYEYDQEQLAKQEELANKEAARQSAIAKLAALGITEEEAKAIIGV